VADTAHAGWGHSAGKISGACLTPIPCLFMRAARRRGPFFLESDLPPMRRSATACCCRDGFADLQQSTARRPDPLTSKVAIVARSERPARRPGNSCFAQVLIKEPRVDTTPNCGNMLAAVAAFCDRAAGSVAARAPETTVRVLTRNTGTLSGPSPCRRPAGRSRTRVRAHRRLPGHLVPIRISFLETAAPSARACCPTGHIVGRIRGVKVTCIDNGMPVAMSRPAILAVPATSLGTSSTRTRS